MRLNNHVRIKDSTWEFFIKKMKEKGMDSVGALLDKIPSLLAEKDEKREKKERKERVLKKKLSKKEKKKEA